AREGDVRQPRPIVVHVSNHADEPQPVRGGRATVTLLAPKMAPLRVELQPDGEARLAGSAVYPDDPARFEPLAPRKAAEAHDHDHDHAH
nr:hypothetical protein [Xanthomonadales bacterium]